MTGPQYPADQQLAHAPETGVSASEQIEILQLDLVVLDVNRALRRLEALGVPDNIAAFLAERKITGVPGVANHCPVSRYVLVETTHRISVCRDFWMQHRQVTIARSDQNMSRNVADFIREFDNGFYPVLNSDRLAHPSAGTATT